LELRRYLIPGLIAIFLLLCIWQYFFRLPGVPIRAESAISSNTAVYFDYADGRNFLQQRGDLLADSLLAGWLTHNHAQAEFDIIRRSLGRFRKLREQPFHLLIGLQNAGTGTITANAIADVRRTGFELDSLIASLRPEQEQTFRFKTFRIHRLRFKNGSELSLAQHRNLLFIARQTLLVEESLSRLASPMRSLWRARSFKPMRYGAREQTPFSTLINPGNLSVLFSGWLSPNGKQRIAAAGRSVAWLRLDPQGDSARIHFDGKLSANENGNSWTAAARQRPGRFAKMLQIIPESVAAVHWLAVSNPNRIAQDRSALFQKYIQPWIGREMAAVRTQTGRFWLVQMANAQQAESALAALAAEVPAAPATDYYAYRIQQLASEHILDVLPFHLAIANPFVTTVDDFVIFADSQSALEVWLDEYIVGKTLAQDADFLHVFQPLKDEKGQVFTYFNFVNLAPDIRRLLQGNALLASGQPEKTGQIAALFKKARRGWDLNGYWRRLDQALPAGETNIAWKTLLDFDAITPPMPVGNDPSQPEGIVVQDSALNLYLLRPDGTIQWKKQLDGQLLSEVHSINYYNEREISLLFNTPGSIHLLSMSGKSQGAFPISLQTRATNGVAVVDFNRNRNYSFFVACANGAIYGFDRLGRPLPGWNPLRGVGEVRHSLLHFQDRERDFLVMLNESGRLMVHRRDGGNRFAPKNLGEPFSFPSPPDFQLSNQSNRIVVADRRGTLHIVGLNGAYFRLPLLPEARQPVQFVFADITGDERKDYLALSGRRLRIKRYDAQDNFEVLRDIQLDDVQDGLCKVRLPDREKAGVGLISSGMNQIRLVLPGGKLHPDFPLAGDSAFFISDLFANGQQVLVVASGDSVYAYRVSL
jgi:hypothetical protein